MGNPGSRSVPDSGPKRIQHPAGRGLAALTAGPALLPALLMISKVAVSTHCNHNATNAVPTSKMGPPWLTVLEPKMRSGCFSCLVMISWLGNQLVLPSAELTH
jgi:hypothetical protein